MTSVILGQNTTNKSTFTSVNGRVYIANDFDVLKVVNADEGFSAGITGPAAVIGAATAAAGNTTNGTHLIRYRYKDSRTQFVSNPSDALSVAVSGGNGTLTFDIGTAGTDITRSTDGKVDTIQIEMTPVADGTFWLAKSVLQVATTVAVSISDAVLTAGTNIDATLGSADGFDLFSHEVPPVCALIATMRNRTFVGGNTPYSIALTVTSNNTAFSGTGFSPNWVGRLIQTGAETTQYEIATVGSLLTTGTLTSVYTGASGSKTFTVFSKFPNRVYYSRFGYPESYFASQYARDVLQGRGDTLRAMYASPDAMYFFGKYSSDRLAFVTDPSATTSSLINIKGNRGVLNQRCLVEADGRLFAWDRQGIYEVSDVPQAISGPVDTYLSSTSDFDYASSCHGGYDPVEKVLIWFFVASGDTVPKYAVCKELYSNRWFFYNFLQGITSSAVIAGSDGQVRLWLGDENGYRWAFSGVGSFDGVPPLQTAVVTVAASSTTSVLNTNEPLNTSLGMAGATVYVPTTGQTGIVASNTASAITLATALTTLPATNAELWLGSIPFIYETKWFEGAGRETKMSPAYFYISLYPGSASGLMQIYLYTDYDESQPESFTLSADDQTPDGVTVVGGVLTVDLAGGVSADGFLNVPLTAGWDRALKVRMVSQKPIGALRIMDVGFRITKNDEREVNK